MALEIRDEPVESPSKSMDSGEFVRLFAQHQRGIHSYICSLAPSRSDADDVMQETSLVLWRKWDEFDRSRDFLRWACGIAFKEVLKVRRKAATSRCYFNEALLEQIAAEAVRQSEDLELRHIALIGCMKKLTPRDRELIERRYQSKTTARQVAGDLGRSSSTVYKALMRIRSSLLGCIERSLAQESHP